MAKDNTRIISQLTNKHEIYIIRKLQLHQREGTPISNTVGPLFMASDQDLTIHRQRQTYTY